jgi:hypothetical protein
MMAILTLEEMTVTMMGGMLLGWEGESLAVLKALTIVLVREGTEAILPLALALVRMGRITLS